MGCLQKLCDVSNAIDLNSKYGLILSYVVGESVWIIKQNDKTKQKVTEKCK